jgi:hypothetical protein
MGLIACGDVCLLTDGGIEVPAWRHGELFVEGLEMQVMRSLKLSITAHGLVELLKANLMRTWSDADLERLRSSHGNTEGPQLLWICR